MGQASILKFLRKYRKSKAFQAKKWLSTKEIHEKMKNTKDGSAISSTTTSIKKLRDSEMIKSKELRINKSSRMVMHYRS